MMKTLILFPLKLEMTIFLRRVQALGHQVREIRVDKQSAVQIEGLPLVLAVGGHGKTQFAIHTQFFIHHLKDIKRVLCAGCSGGLNPDLSVGSVVVGTETIEHDFLLRFVSRPSPLFAGDEKLISEMSSVVKNEKLDHVFFGRIASGDEDIVEGVRAREIFNATQAMAVAWEGAGGARACRFNDVPYLEIRGISDSASQIEMQDFADGLKQAIEPIADLILKWTSQNRTSNL